MAEAEEREPCSSADGQGDNQKQILKRPKEDYDLVMKLFALGLASLLLLTGCASVKSTNPESATLVPDPIMSVAPDLIMSVRLISNWYCEPGHFGLSASVRVYDESTGNLLASGVLNAADDPIGCAYSLDNLKVPLVDTYRTVIDGNSQRTIVSSVVDLKVAASEMNAQDYSFMADLFLTKFYNGWSD